MTTKGWLDLLPYTLVPILVLNFFLFLMLRGSGSLLTAFITFSVCNIGMRILSAFFILKEPVGRGMWIALGLLGVAQLAKFWG